MRDIRKKRNPETAGRFGISLAIPLLFTIYLLWCYAIGLNSTASPIAAAMR